MDKKQVNIFFDLDGTLIEISQKYYDIYVTLVHSWEGNPLLKNTFWERKRNKVSWYEILLESNIKPHKHESWISYFLELIESQEYLAKDDIFPNGIDTLTRLQQCFNLNLVTHRRSKENTIKQLHNLHILKFFTQMQIENSIEKAILIEKIGGKPGDIVVGDTEADISAAKRLGLTSIAVLSGIRSKSYLDTFSPDYIINDITALPFLLHIK